MKRIVVYPLGGLCNKMRTIAAAYALAQRVGADVTAIWPRYSGLNCHFEELFQPLPFQLIGTKADGLTDRLIRFYIKRLRGYAIIDDEWIHANMRGANAGEKSGSEALNFLRSHNLFIHSCEDVVRNNVDYDIFQLQPPLQQPATNLLKGDETVGIHIRRTDNAHSISTSPTSLFVEKMENMLVTNSQTKFFLATDDPREEQELKDRFPNKIITHRKQSLDRNSPSGIRDAAIDLYCLSRCKLILASYGSSFSDIAALWGRTNKITIGV